MVIEKWKEGEELMIYDDDGLMAVYMAGYEAGKKGKN